MHSLRLRRITLVLSVSVGMGGAIALAMTGCGDDTSGTGGGDSGSDVTADSNPDISVDAPVEAAPDVVEGGSDVVVVREGGPDSGPDGDGGCTPDPAAVQWPAQQARALCMHFASCCFGADAGAFNEAQCESDNSTDGWEYSLPGYSPDFNTCKIAINPTNATNCLNAISALPCGNVTAAQYAAVTAACTPVLQGTVPVGQGGCDTAFQCVPGSYCDTRTDGGVCSTLVGQGQPCTQAPIDQACSYLSFGTPALYCDRITPLDAGGGLCQPRQADNANCVDSMFNYYDEACSSLLCNNNGTCGGSITLPAAFYCQYYTLDGGSPSDAGGGG